MWIKGPAAAAAAAKLLQSCLTLCDSIDSSPPGFPVPGILQARTLEWVAISFSNAWKWKVKMTLLSCVWLLATPWTAAYQAPPVHGIFQARVLEWGVIAFSYSGAYIIPTEKLKGKWGKHREDQRQRNSIVPHKLPPTAQSYFHTRWEKVIACSHTHKTSFM